MRYPDDDEMDYIGLRESKREGHDWVSIGLLILLVIGILFYVLVVRSHPELADTVLI